MAEEKIVKGSLDAVHVLCRSSRRRRKQVLHIAPGDRRERVPSDVFVDAVFF